MAFWDRISSRGDVEDRRSMAPVIGGGVTLTGVALLLLFTYVSGGSITDTLSQLDPSLLTQQQTQRDTSQFEGKDSYEVFASTVLGSANDLWSKEFANQHTTYAPPKLVLFRDYTDSGCGGASSQVGPHYCPEDQTIYLDETFFEELTSRFGAKGGDVAQAYVMAHEVGHHVQNELGIMDRVLNTRRSDASSDNALSVKMELQADCFAGIWAKSVQDRNVLEPGEINEALDAAAAVGDDRIQKKATGYIQPETWTHGSSRQRVQWFTKGFQSGSITECDTFQGL